MRDQNEFMRQMLELVDLAKAQERPGKRFLQ